MQARTWAIRVACVSGAAFLDASRDKLFARGPSSVVFVADARPQRMEAMLESVEGIAMTFQLAVMAALGLPPPDA